MALVFADSFDHYIDTQSPRKWSFVSGTPPIITGRTYSGVQISGGANYRKDFSPDSATVTAGAAYKTRNFSNWILNIQNSSKSYVPAVRATHTGDGRLYISIDGAPASEVFTSFVMNLNQWYYVELSAEVSNAPSGTDTYAATSAVCRVNGITIGSVTTTSTGSAYKLSGTNSFTYASLQIMGPGGGNSADYDDLYITSPPDGFLGDIKVEILRPNGDHATTDWVATGTSTGTDDYTYVNENTPNDNTNYLLSTASGQVEFLEMSNTPTFTGTIQGIQPIWCASGDGGAGTFTGLLLDGTGTGGTATTSVFNTTTSYVFLHEGFRLSPFTGVNWTTVEVDAVKQGQKG